MARNLVSPGISFGEIDLSQVAQVTALMGPAFVGTTQSGPAFKPTIINNYSNEFIPLYGGLNTSHYVPYAVKYYLKYGSNAVVCRILGTNANIATKDDSFIIPASASWNDVAGSGIISSSGIIPFAVLRKRSGSTTTSLSASFNTTSQMWTVSGNGDFGGPYVFNDTNIEAYFTRDAITIPPSPSCSSLYLDVLYWTQATENSADNGTGDVTLSDIAYDNMSIQTLTAVTTIKGSYTYSSTPWIVDAIGPDGSVPSLFRFHTIGEGQESNNDCKISIESITRKTDSIGSPYYTFDVIVRKWDDSDSSPIIYEKFVGCTLLTNDKNYIVKKIGDMYEYLNVGTNRIDVTGTWPNKSNYIRVEMSSDSVPMGARPSGFRGLQSLKDTVTTSYPFRNFRVNQTNGNSQYKKSIFLGWDGNSFGAECALVGAGESEYNTGKGFLMYDAGRWSGSANEMTGATGSTAKNNFHLVPMYASEAVYSSTAGAFATGATNTIGGVDWHFTVPVFGGRDGYKKTLQGASLITALSAEYNAAIDILGNADMYDFNMLVIPGTDGGIRAHRIIMENAIDMVETRGDAIYIQDFFTVTATNQASPGLIDDLESFDSSYAAVYWPWIKVYDAENEDFVWLPPSTLVAAQLAYNDKVAYPWYAPAGVNRGQLVNAVAARYQLNQDDRDTLYENRINPIATFRNEGVVIWGQKTLQKSQTALDRVNVRRMLVYAKKLISRVAIKLIFEPNNSTTWNRFKGEVNPILTNIAVNNGLEKFLIIMDSSTNTPDKIDRNEMYGQIMVIPTRAAEALYVDFIIHRTGVEFGA